MASSLDRSKAKKRLRPIEARSLNQICSLPRDNLDARGYWIIFDECRVTIAAQKAGEAPTAEISIPRAQFDRMARWYVTGKATK